MSTVSPTAATASNGARDSPVSPSPRTDARIESTSRSSRDTWSSAASCHSRALASIGAGLVPAAASPRRSTYARTTDSGVRSSWVTTDSSSARAASSAVSCWRRASISACSRPFATMPARSAAIVVRNSISARRKFRLASVWTLSTPTTSSCHTSGTDSIAWRPRMSNPRTHEKRAVGRDVARRRSAGGTRPRDR